MSVGVQVLETDGTAYYVPCVAFGCEEHFVVWFVSIRPRDWSSEGTVLSFCIV